MFLRQEKEEEFPVIYELVKEAFQTAKVSNGDEQNFANRLRAGESYLPELALVAEEDGRLIGHIMLTGFFVQTAKGPRPLLLLGPLSVSLESRNKGVGTGLTEESFRLARAKGHDAVIVVGDPLYYSRFGFRPSADFGITNEDHIPDEYVMALELVSGALQDVKGTISFRACLSPQENGE